VLGREARPRNPTPLMARTRSPASRFASRGAYCRGCCRKRGTGRLRRVGRGRSLLGEAVGQTLGARKSCAFVTTRPLRAESFRSRNALVGWLCGSHAVGDIACCRSRTSRNLCPTASGARARADVADDAAAGALLLSRRESDTAEYDLPVVLDRGSRTTRRWARKRVRWLGAASALVVTVVALVAAAGSSAGAASTANSASALPTVACDKSIDNQPP